MVCHGYSNNCRWEFLAKTAGCDQVCVACDLVYFKDFWAERYCETTTLYHVQNDRPLLYTSSSLFVFQSFAHSSAATQTWSCLLNAYWFSGSLRFCSNLLCLQWRFPGFVWHLNFGQIIWPVDWSSSTLRIELILVRDQPVWTPVFYPVLVYIWAEYCSIYVYNIVYIYASRTFELERWHNETAT